MSVDDGMEIEWFGMGDGARKWRVRWVSMVRLGGSSEARGSFIPSRALKTFLG